MSRPTNKLTTTTVKTTKSAEKTVRLVGGGGLYLEIRPTGSKYWRIKERGHIVE